MQITSVSYHIVPRDDPRLAGRLSYINVTEAAVWEQGFREGEASAEVAAEINHKVKHILDSGLWTLFWDEPSDESLVAETVFQVVPRGKLPPGEILAGYEDDGFWGWMIHEDHMSVALAEEITATLHELLASGRMRLVQQR